MRVAVIGAGASGIVAARHVVAAGLDCDVLEASQELGGTWVYKSDAEQDQYGFPVYCNLYKNVMTNLPKELMGFTDFPVKERDYSYLTHEEVLEFLNQYVDQFGLKAVMKFNRLVTEIRRDSEKWQVKSIDKPTKQEIVEFYDAIMVCIGHYNEPLKPKLPGEEKFKGKTLHSVQYRTPDPYKNQRVLVVGGGSSGFDIVVDVALEAQSVVLSHHNKNVPKMKFPPNVSLKPDILRLEEEKVLFVDDSCEGFDTIIFCTGYKHSYPFLHESCGIVVKDYSVQPLYKHLININHPTMCLIGVNCYTCHFTLSDLQAQFFCKYLSDAMSLPPPETMQQDAENEIKMRKDRGYSDKQLHFLGPFQQGYFESLTKAANLAPIPQVIHKMFDDFPLHFHENFDHFRRAKYEVIDEENYKKHLNYV